MRKISLLLSVAVFATLSFVLSGCGDDESSSASLTLTLDGEKMKVKTVTGMLIYSEESGHESRSLNITGSLNNGDLFTIQIANWDFQNPPKDGFIKKKYYNIFEGEDGIEAAECIEVDEVTLCDAAAVTYMVDGDDIYTSAFDEDLAGFVEVTASKGKKISGNFDVIVTGFSNEVDIRATGTFKNVGYAIIPNM